MRKKILSVVLFAVLLTSMFAALPALAATEDEIEESIVKGLAWLAEVQNPDGSWPGNDPVAATGLAVLKFIDRAKELGEDPFLEQYEYHTTVVEGLDYIFENAYTMDISAPQPHGDPDSDGDDLGVYFETLGSMWHRSYSTGICLMAISAADVCADILGNPSPIVAVGPLAGWSYEDVIQDTVDYMAFGQNDGGDERGGWGYYDNYVGWSDNSNSGWVTLGLGYALASGATIPPFVYDELNIWIDYIQNDVDGDADDGGSGYDVPDSWVNMLKTGNLLYQMALVGDTADTQRVKDAIDYQERHWNDANWDPGWKGPGYSGEDWAHHQATFCIMKGFEAFGVDLIDLDDDSIPEHDWFDDISTRIVQTQNPDGSWYYDAWGDDILSTTWALLTLEKVVEVPRIPVYVDIKPGSWPNPINKGSKGVFAVAVCGTEDLDVMTLDPETVMIYIEGVEEGVPPLRWAYEDVATPYTGDPGGGHELGGDGYTDLVLHFDTQEVVVTLELCVYDDETVPLLVRGNLLEEHGGTAIEGQDYVWLKEPKGKG
jgi:hypothetical protein